MSTQLPINPPLEAGSEIEQNTRERFALYQATRQAELNEQVTKAQRALANAPSAPVPAYSIRERESDTHDLTFQCPISQDFAVITLEDEPVQLPGDSQVYRGSAVIALAAQNPTFRNPLNRTIINERDVAILSNRNAYRNSVACQHLGHRAALAKISYESRAPRRDQDLAFRAFGDMRVMHERIIAQAGIARPSAASFTTFGITEVLLPSTREEQHAAGDRGMDITDLEVHVTWPFSNWGTTRMPCMI
jgi:hypothetical protein